MDLSTLLSLLGKHQDEDDTLKNATSQATDEAQMTLHPEMQGPRVGFDSPDQQKLSANLGNAVMAGVNPVKMPKIMQMFGSTPEEAQVTANEISKRLKSAPSDLENYLASLKQATPEATAKTAALQNLATSAVPNELDLFASKEAANQAADKMVQTGAEGSDLATAKATQEANRQQDFADRLAKQKYNNLANKLKYARGQQ